VQMRTRVAGVLAVAASAVAMMGGPAFASNSPSVGNITGNSNVSTLSGNNVQIPAGYPPGVRRPWSWLSWSPQHPPSGTRRGLERDEP
jgi:hypothetical protein